MESFYWYPNESPGSETKQKVTEVCIVYFNLSTVVSAPGGTTKRDEKLQMQKVYNNIVNHHTKKETPQGEEERNKDTKTEKPAKRGHIFRFFKLPYTSEQVLREKKRNWKHMKKK